jgi:hypothetical protein
MALGCAQRQVGSDDAGRPLGDQVAAGSGIGRLPSTVMCCSGMDNFASASPGGSAAIG